VTNCTCVLCVERRALLGPLMTFWVYHFPLTFCLPAFRPYMGYQRCFLVQDLQETVDLYRAQKRQREKAFTCLLKVPHIQQPIFCTTSKHRRPVWTPLNSPTAALSIKDPLLAELNHLYITWNSRESHQRVWHQ
jgi:hypothetical protein